jgi:outer membrane protein insertion porin family
VACGRAGMRQLIGLAAVLLISACGVRSTAADLYPQLAEHQGRRVSEVRFRNPDPFRADSLARLVNTQPSRCRFLGIPICVPFTRIGREEHHVNAARIEGDLASLEQAFRIAGYFNTRVTPDIEEDGNDVEVIFDIQRGRPVVLDQLTVTGTEPVMHPDTATRRLPLQPGDIFHLGRFVESAELMVRAAHRRGHAYAEVLRSFSVDTIDSRAEAALDVVLGPVVTVDSIVVRGVPSLGRAAVLRQIEVAPGDLLRQSSLLESQRNLYQLEIVSLVSVTVAPDTLQADPADQSRATVLVSVAEAPLREVEAAIGFGNVECLRTDGQWVHRSFFGGARRLAFRGSLSRLGVGEPFAIGGGGLICPRTATDTIFGGDTFDYRLSADFTQPYFLNARNQLGLSAYAERLSEPGVYQRQAIGGRTGISRRLGARSGVSGALEAERGTTRASPALFCAAFQVCEPETVAALAGRRYRSVLGLSAFVDAANAPLDPSSGYVARTAVSWSPAILGSEVTFFRWSGSGAAYRELAGRRVGAVSLRLGNFFRTIGLDAPDAFLPPEERFYAGGPASVRGFERNGLGPGVYVTDAITVTEGGDTLPDREPNFVPTGGTAVAVASVELRVPSPFWSDLMRLVAFVDAGAVGTRALWDLASEDWRVTPGAGLRLQTPVGPLRVDVGYNPHPRPVAPLLFSEIGTGRVVRIADEHQADAPGFFGRLRVHLGIGHAF